MSFKNRHATKINPGKGFFSCCRSVDDEKPKKSFFSCFSENSTGVKHSSNCCKSDSVKMSLYDDILGQNLQSYTNEPFSGDRYENDSNDTEIEPKKNGCEFKSIIGLYNMLYKFKDKLSSLSYDANININIPTVVMVGTQTSGKSSIINNLIGKNIVPIGENMITRTPLNITLINGYDDMITISYVNNSKKICIYSDKYSNADLKKISNKIEYTTNMITGGDFLISSTSIYIEIVSPLVDDLILIDLPGIITISQTDKGQPESMVDDIYSLIKENLDRNNVFIVSVIQSKTDLETDIGLSTVKNLSKNKTNIKTLGILTKPDLLDPRTLGKFENIFTSNISKNIALDYGYYVVNNCVPKSYSDNDVEWYKEFFADQPSIIEQNRFGIDNIKAVLRKQLNIFLKKQVPDVKNALEDVRKKLDAKIPKVENIISDNKSKVVYMSAMTYIMSKLIFESINSIGNINNIGMKIKNIIGEFEKSTEMLEPMNKVNLPDSKLKSIIENYEGLNASILLHPKINYIINRCITDEEQKPLKRIYECIEICINKICDEIYIFAKHLLKMKNIDSYPITINKYNIDMTYYPKLVEFFDGIILNLLQKYKTDTLKIILEQIGIQEIQTIILDNNDIVELEITDELYSVQSSVNEISQETTVSNTPPPSTTSFNLAGAVNAFNTSKTSPVQPLASNTSTLQTSTSVQQSSNLANLSNKNTVNASRKKSMTYLRDEKIYNLTAMRTILNATFKRLMSFIRELSIKTLSVSMIKKVENKLCIDIYEHIRTYEDIDGLFVSQEYNDGDIKKVNNLIEETNEFIKAINLMM